MQEENENDDVNSGSHETRESLPFALLSPGRAKLEQEKSETRESLPFALLSPDRAKLEQEKPDTNENKPNTNENKPKQNEEKQNEEKQNEEKQNEEKQNEEKQNEALQKIQNEAKIEEILRDWGFLFETTFVLAKEYANEPGTLEDHWLIFTNNRTPASLNGLIPLINLGVKAYKAKCVQENTHAVQNAEADARKMAEALKRLKTKLELQPKNKNLENEFKRTEEKAKRLEETANEAKMKLQRDLRARIVVCSPLNNKVTLRGFTDLEEVKFAVNSFHTVLNNHLSSWYIGIRGSAVTGLCHNATRGFRAGGETVNDASDIDFFFASPELETSLKYDVISPKKLQNFFNSSPFVGELQEVSQGIKEKIGRKADIALCKVKVAESNDVFRLSGLYEKKERSKQKQRKKAK